MSASPRNSVNPIGKSVDRYDPFQPSWLRFLNDCFAAVGSTGHHNTFCSLSAGVSKSKIFRGRWLSRRATAFS